MPKKNTVGRCKCDIKTFVWMHVCKLLCVVSTDGDYLPLALLQTREHSALGTDLQANHMHDNINNKRVVLYRMTTQLLVHKCFWGANVCHVWSSLGQNSAHLQHFSTHQAEIVASRHSYVARPEYSVDHTLLDIMWQLSRPTCYWSWRFWLCAKLQRQNALCLRKKFWSLAPCRDSCYNLCYNTINYTEREY